MQWTDQGVVLGVRRHGEANAIVELMTEQHGRYLGLVRGGAGARQRPVLQPGNSVAATWRARLDEHLGSYQIEGTTLRTGRFLSLPHAVHGVTHLGALCRLLPERDPHPLVHGDLEQMLETFDAPLVAAALVVRFEHDLLGELGFGLDLGECAATGATEDLVYVSPRTGRAVSREAGAPWRDKLLALPSFLRGEGGLPAAADIVAGQELTGHFLARYVLDPRGLDMPAARGHFFTAALRAAPPAVAVS